MVTEPTVLFVDDQYECCKGDIDFLESNGFHVEWADSVRMAIRKLTEIPTVGMVVDLMIPDDDHRYGRSRFPGGNLIMEVREGKLAHVSGAPIPCDLPIVISTGARYDDPSMSSGTMIGNHTLLLQKPYSSEELLEAVVLLLRLRNDPSPP